MNKEFFGKKEPSKTYKVFMTQGQGSGLIAETNSLEEALELYEEIKRDGSIGIEYPNGTYHKWE